jgi:hypothetical protein
VVVPKWYSQLISQARYRYPCRLAPTLWAAWGIHVRAYALVLLQAGLLALNVRGMRKTDAQAASQES